VVLVPHSAPPQATLATLELALKASLELHVINSGLIISAVAPHVSLTMASSDGIGPPDFVEIQMVRWCEEALPTTVQDVTMDHLMFSQDENAVSALSALRLELLPYMDV